jgi:hypothetical protein
MHANPPTSQIWKKKNTDWHVHLQIIVEVFLQFSETVLATQVYKDYYYMWVLLVLIVWNPSFSSIYSSFITLMTWVLFSSCAEIFVHLNHQVHPCHQIHLYALSVTDRCGQVAPCWWVKSIWRVWYRWNPHLQFHWCGLVLSRCPISIHAVNFCQRCPIFIHAMHLFHVLNKFSS